MNHQTTYDCIVIGGGITGSALAYELAKRKLKVLLLEKDQFINNATTCSYGGLPYQAGTNPEISSLFAQSIQIYRQLSEELEQNIEFRELDLLLTIDSTENPQEVAQQYSQCHELPELLSVDSACKLEPLLNPESISGALRLSHAHVNATRVNMAYQNAFKRLSGEIRYEKVTDLIRKANQIQGVITDTNKYYSSHTIVSAGGLSRFLLESIGITSKIYFTNCVVLKVPAQKKLQLNVMLMPATIKRFTLEAKMSQADLLWQKLTPETQESIVDIGAVQFQDGSIYLGQASHIISDPFANLDLDWSQRQIKAGIEKLLPKFVDLPFTAQNCLVAFSGDPNRPMMGAIPLWSGIYLFSGFTKTILLAPVLARALAEQIST